MFDVNQIADAVTGAKTPDAAWKTFSDQLAAEGLGRTALHSALPLDAENPFASERTGRTFGAIWEPAYDRRVRRYRGDVRTAAAPDLLHLRPTLKFLGVSRSPLFIDHREVVASRGERVFKPLCRIMIGEMGQYQGLALPLRDPASGMAAILSAWGDEDRGEFSAYVKAHLDLLHLAGHYFLGMLDAKWPARSDEGSGSNDLSERERQVLSLYARGFRTAGVADHLRISERSTNEYVTRARRKLRARTRAEAVARATILDLL